MISSYLELVGSGMLSRHLHQSVCEWVKSKHGKEPVLVARAVYLQFTQDLEEGAMGKNDFLTPKAVSNCC